ncbi:uncharacterized protein LOC113855654 [Abrus precatorius]|uniref:Uncharacterized protein LOC113855654 n=1 Tax=Abrus precatorius TaxID=3816 RepID=A0A8B8KGZ3_ABRPR|nr:uncharacterized protein LOC113855654 [Abrus precatorius]
MYNLPPWLCMKQKYMMLFVLISSPKQPENDIDVYLSPLIEDLKLLWDNGIEVYDEFRDENFTVKAMLYGIINDFPTYRNLSGYSIKGHCACPICQEKIDYVRLDHCHKNVFMGHRRWLSKNHPFRKMKKAFNGSCEERRCPYLKRGEEIFDEVKHIRTTFEKLFAKQISTCDWYIIKHCGKKEDDINARLDLVKLGIRFDLAPVKKGKRTFLSPTACTLLDMRNMLYTIHLVEETKLCGPAYMQWMYPVERYMKILKGYVKNRSRPEICIAKRYLVEEAVKFCNEYLSNVESCGIPKSRHTGKTLGEGSSGCQQIEVPRLHWEQAHLYVLQNTPKIEPYISLHKETLKRRNPSRCENWITKEHNQRFLGWLQEYVGEQLKQNNNSVAEMIQWLSKGPCIDAFSYTSYLVNGFTFYTKQHDDQSTMQNSGVTLVAESLHISNAKDKNPIYANMSYFGVNEHIWELDYTNFRVAIFGCKWVDNNSGVRIDDMGFIRVDFKKVDYQDDSFILASQARQVFYVEDPVNKSWSIVLMSNKINAFTDGELTEEEVNMENDPLRSVKHMSIVDTLTDDEDIYARHNHEEGIWLNPSFHSIKGHRKLKMTSSDNMDGSTPHQSTEANKKGRGITKFKSISKSRKLGQKLQVGWNGKGQLIDPNRSKFAHFIGFVTRSTVPISYSDWTNVPTNVKEHIWEQVEQTFEVDDVHKDFVLFLAGRDLCAFQTRLRKHIYDKDRNYVPHPPDKYQRFITITDH